MGPVTVTQRRGVARPVAREGALHAPRRARARRRGREGAVAHRGLPAQRSCRIASNLYSVPQLHFVYDDSIERGMRAVAADRRRGRGRQETLARSSHGRARIRAAASTASCSSTSRPASRRTRRCRRAKRLYRAQKAGHTGTLDPLASGLLPLCFGEATKFAQRLLDAPKAYTAHGPLRRRRPTTGDAEGEVRDTRAVRVDARSARRPSLRSFVGEHDQCRPCTRRSSSRAARTTSMRAPAARSRATPRASRFTRSTSSIGSPPDAVVAVALQQGHVRPRAGRGHRRGAGLRRAPRGAAPDRRPAASRSTQAVAARARSKR